MNRKKIRVGSISFWIILFFIEVLGRRRKFYGWELCKFVKSKREYVMDGTILRALRYLRKRNLVYYTTLIKEESLYKLGKIEKEVREFVKKEAKNVRV